MPHKADVSVALSVALAAGYWYHSESHKTTSIIAIKTASTALLTLAHYLREHPIQGRLFTLSMAGHCIGDFLLELSLIYAIPFFLFGHMLYAWKLKNNCIRLNEINMHQIMALIIIGIYSMNFTQLLRDNTHGVLYHAIPIYCVALTAMFMLTVLQKQNAKSLFFAATLYVLSDSLIGMNKFVKKLPGIGYITWPLYFAGQAFAAKCLWNNKKSISP